MMRSLLNLLMTQPKLLADHAAAYAEMAATEMGVAAAVCKRQVMLTAAAICCWTVAAILTGVALMLWAVVPETSMHAPWVLIAIPMLPVAVALWCGVVLRALAATQPFADVRQQLRADLGMLREVSAP